MALRFYDPGGPNLLNGSSCSRTRCLWNCFPWDVRPVNVTVLAGLTSSRSRKDLPLARGQTSEEMTCLRPASACSRRPSLTVPLRLRPFFSPLTFLSIYNVYTPLSLPFLSASLLRTLLFYTYFSLCPSLSLLPWLLPSSNEMGGKRADGRYRGLWYSCHSSLSFSLSPS